MNVMKNSSKGYKYLTFLTAIYTFCFILPSLLIRKMVDVPILGVIPISILFTGTYFVLLDVITEVYGFYQARKVLYAGLIAYTLFVFTMEFIKQIPSPLNYHVEWSATQNADAYAYLFSNLYLVWISVGFCTLFANTFNMIFLSKWKRIANGRYFWIRSITTSLAAAVVYSFLSNLFAFGFFMPIEKIPYFIELTLISISAKLITLLIFAYPANILCFILKNKEKVDAYDNVGYNPFRSDISLQNKETS